MGALVLAFAAIGGAIVAPSLTPAAGVAERTPSVPAAGGAEPPLPAVIRHGVVGAVSGVNPLTAQTQAERDLVALVFSGLVRLGPEQSYEPGLASRWTVTPDGATWTFELREDARWHDGTPVTPRDVVFTVDLLRDAAAASPSTAAWRDVTATTAGERGVMFKLGTPIAGFLDVARQPLLPSHLLAGVQASDLPAHPFNRRPVGTGPYRLRSLDAETAQLEPADLEGRATPSPTTPARPTDPLPTPPRPAPELPPDVPADLELRFCRDAPSLVAAWEAGQVDVASGLPAADAARLGGRGDARLIPYPTTTLTTVLLNVRPDRRDLRVAATRRALLQAIDRPSLIADAWAGHAALADAPIPPSSWAFDATASPRVEHDPAGAAAALEQAGWRRVDDGWIPPGATRPWSLEVLSADAVSNPADHAAGAAVAADLQRLGIDARHVALEPAELVGGRLRTARFGAAVVDVNIGLEPDLYPLLASSQTRTSGLNLGGVVDAELDRLLVAARAPGGEARRGAFKALQERLASQQYLLPLAFRDELVVVRDGVFGVTPRLIGDPGDRFWDVLAWRLAAGR